MYKEMSLWEHIVELRYRLIVCLIFVGIGIVVSFPFSKDVFGFLELPCKGIIHNFVFFSPQDAFLVYLRISILTGLVISLPVIMFQVWEFIAPAMERKTQKYIVIFVLFATLLFLAGMAFIFLLVLPAGLKFLLLLGGTQLTPMISAASYISFVVGTLIAGGIIFQMPVLSFFLTKFGMLNWKFLTGKIRYAIVGIFIVAAILAPSPDMFSMFMMAIPMFFLYGVSLLVSFIANPKSGNTNVEILQNT
ncbi:MAG: twin-arginine translocase subunit TatC [Candidatus Omnitrophica bacterium]|nr:twin-arginine translocase subunit TatC [Candidatus Omnitrophota bacterium]